MLTRTTCADSLRAITEQLRTQEQELIIPASVARAFGGQTVDVRYLGHGQEIAGPEANFGLYIRGATRENHDVTHELHVGFSSQPGADGVRRTLGHFSLYLFGDGRIHPAAEGFNRQEEADAIPLELLAAPLGKWVTSTAVDTDRINREARAALTRPDMRFVTMTAEDIAPVGAFLDDPNSKAAYFTFHHGPNGLYDGIISQSS